MPNETIRVLPRGLQPLYLIHRRCGARQSRSARSLLPGFVWRWAMALVLLGIVCSSELGGQTRCSAGRTDASNLAGITNTAGVELDSEAAYCAGTASFLLAEAAFDAGKLAEASRYASTAIRMLQGQSAARAELQSALRIEVAIHIERGKLNEARASIDRLKTLPAESPAQQATLRGFAGALYQAEGDHRAAEREYVEAIRLWDGIHGGANSIAVRSNLSVVYLEMKRFDEAVVVLERALSLIAGTKENPEYYRLVLTNNLAVSYRERGDTAKAVGKARAAVRLADAARVGRYELIANVYANSATILRAAGRQEEASDLDTRANRAQAMANALVDVSDLTGAQRP